jgi:hypothetical protein
MLRVANSGVWDGAIRPAELVDCNPREPGPELVRGVDVQPFVQVEAKPEPALVDLKKRAKPRTKERDHPRVAVREFHAAIPLGAFARVQRHPSDEELPFRHLADPPSPFFEKELDLSRLPLLKLVWPAAVDRNREIL